jgi:hypothetical protein
VTPFDKRGGFLCAALFFEIRRQFGPRNSVPPKAHIRRHARRPFEAQMQVSWTDARGQVQRLRAKCLDMSDEGARLETDAPILVRTAIALHSARYGSLGNASVRHCVRYTLKYSIGVEFTSSHALAGVGRRRCLDEMQPSAKSQP